MIAPPPILLVDDNVQDVELALAAFENHNLVNEVIVLRNGQEVIDFFERQGPHMLRKPVLPAIVLLDIKMPRVDGFGVLKYIKSRADLKDIPVVMLTGSSENKDIKICSEMGANGYVVKPLEFDQLSQALRGLGAFWSFINRLPGASH